MTGYSDRNIRRPEILDKYDVAEASIVVPWEYQKMQIKEFQAAKKAQRESADRLSYSKVRSLVYSTEDKTETVKTKSKFKTFIFCY